MSLNDTGVPFNLTLLQDPNLCTLATCPLELAQVFYDPTLAGNALYLAIFALLLVVHTALGIRYRIWGFFAGLFGGLVLECIGYVARVQMHFNPFLSNPFLMYIITLTIAPCFFSGSIYLCLSRIIVVYGKEYSRFSPRTYVVTFISCDIFSLVLQAAGGGIADTANTKSLGDIGVNIMVAGLSFQVASILLFIALCSDFALRVRKLRNKQEPLTLDCSKPKFHVFLFAIGVATLAILIRSCFRVAELSGGFSSSLANNEISFMILEGAMISIACIALTVGHPGLYFGKVWKVADIESFNMLETGKREDSTRSSR